MTLEDVIVAILTLVLSTTGQVQLNAPIGRFGGQDLGENRPPPLVHQETELATHPTAW